MVAGRPNNVRAAALRRAMTDSMELLDGLEKGFVVRNVVEGEELAVLRSIYNKMQRALQTDTEHRKMDLMALKDAAYRLEVEDDPPEDVRRELAAHMFDPVAR